jgi:hypothetical protein
MRNLILSLVGVVGCFTVVVCLGAGATAYWLWGGGGGEKTKVAAAKGDAPVGGAPIQLPPSDNGGVAKDGGPKGGVPKGGGTGPQVGVSAPEIEANDLDGKRFKLSDYRGKVVLLDFWGNW